MDAIELVLIGDDRIKNVPVAECGEELVDLLQNFPDLAFDLDRRHVQKDSASISFARRTIGEMLVKTQSFLPAGVKFLVKECHRPMAVQMGFWDGYSSYLRKNYSAWSETQIYEECSKLNAPLAVAPHTTGGAIDLTLVDGHGAWLDMGTEFNASPLNTNRASYTLASHISSGAKANRALLVHAMSSAGFVNYPTEWWHWSFGDKYWAFTKAKSNAIYGPVEIND